MTLGTDQRRILTDNLRPLRALEREDRGRASDKKQRICIYILNQGIV